jgi:HAD superfamily hydrolase (TIGR01549 family)
MTSAAAILDVDGTLIDTNYQHAVSWYLAFRQHDLKIPVWQIHRHLGMGGDHLIRAVAGDAAEAEVGDQVRAAHGVLYLASIQSVSPFDGARALLEDLKALGRTVVLASSAPQRELDHYLDLLDARELIDGFTTAESVASTKPEPDLVLAALEQAGTRNTTMIGDSPWDVAAAKKAGVETIAVLTGGFSEAELREAGAFEVFQSVADLREHLGATVLGRDEA